MEGEELCRGELGRDAEGLRLTGGPCMGHGTGFVVVQMGSSCVSEEFMAAPWVQCLCILTVPEEHRSLLPLWPIEKGS